MEAKLKHLEFIQQITNRMNANSFTLKGWCITLVAALLALATKGADPLYAFISFVPILAFSILDAYYLSQERRYRDLYKAVAACDPATVTFSLDATPYCKGRNSWPAAFFSPTIGVFYGVAALAALGVIFAIEGKFHG